MLRMVDSVTKRRAAWQQFRRELCKNGAPRVRRTLGSRIDSGENTITLRKDLRIWFGPVRQIRNFLWIAFGTLPLPPSGNISMTVQINPSLDPRRQRTAGMLAQDEWGDLWICHTGGVGGGREGIHKSAFLAWTDRQVEPIERLAGPPCFGFRVARLGAPDLSEEVADFVHEVALFKESPKRVTVARTAPFGGSSRENEHSTTVGSRTGYKMSRKHGIVRNRLSELLEQAGLRVTRDGARDIIVGSPKAPSIEFEVKPSRAPYSIYTAVGQLLMHSRETPAKRKVVVLPEGLDSVRKRALADLKIDVVTFRMTRSRISFSGLDRIVPRAASSAAVKRARHA